MAKNVRDINSQNAAEWIGPVSRGMDKSGLSKGQFSLIDMILHVLEETGPVHLDITVWSAGEADIIKMYDLLQDGQILSIRWLVDPSFFSRKKKYGHLLPFYFGEELI